MTTAGDGDDEAQNCGERYRDSEENRFAWQSSTRPATLPHGPMPGRHAIHLHVIRARI